MSINSYKEKEDKFSTNRYLILSWLAFSIVYFYAKMNGYEQYTGYMILASELFLDFSGILIVLLFSTQLKKRKSNYWLLIIFFIMALFGDFYFNLLNLFPGKITGFLFETPFIIFLFVADMILLNIYLSDRLRPKIMALYLIPVVTISIFLGSIFIFAIDWKIKYTSVLGIYQILDTLLEAFGFFLASFFLMVTNKPWLKMGSSGYLIIIAADLIIRCGSVLDLPPTIHDVEPAWILGSLIIVRGVYLFATKKNNVDIQNLFN